MSVPEGLSMRWLQILRLRLRSLSQRAAVERELEDELRFHIDQQVEQNLAAGMDPVEARATPHCSASAISPNIKTSAGMPGGPA
jgi:hypothetical protein